MMLHTFGVQVYSSRFMWKWRGAPYKTTDYPLCRTLYEIFWGGVAALPRISFVALQEGLEVGCGLAVAYFWTAGPFRQGSRLSGSKPTDAEKWPGRRLCLQRTLPRSSVGLSMLYRQERAPQRSSCGLHQLPNAG